MPITLNDVIDLSIQPELDADTVSAYGLRTAPCQREEFTINRQTEYMLTVWGKTIRVFNFEQSGREGRMYVKDAYGDRLFLPEEIVTMLTYGKPSYDHMTPVAQSVTVAA
jgi:hypothetical protein